METAETTGNPAQMKRMNIESIYRALIDYKAATRAEIAQRTKISITTIRALMEELRAKEEIVEASIDASSGGRRAIRYTLNPKKTKFFLFSIRIMRCFMRSRRWMARSYRGTRD